MKKSTTLLLTIVSVSCLTLSLWAAQDDSWFDKFFNKKTPSTLTDNAPQTPRIEPPKEVVNLQDSFAKVAEAVKPAVVNIAAVQIQRVKEDPYQFFYGDPDDFMQRFFGQPNAREREYRREGTGSGVIISPEGHILTNNHVVQGADQLTITLESGKTLKGEVIGTDPRTDLAVVKIKGSTDFSYVPLGDSSKMRVGDWVIAVGSPFGLQQTVTAGIVSAIRQSLNIEGRSFSNLIQTDAAINRGNSGGPLVNLKGELIGINSAIYAPTGVFSGIGFAIPVNEAKLIIKDLINKGYVERSWLGVEIGDLNDVVVQQFDLESTDGALVNKVVPDSPADNAGILRGDVLTEINGKKIKNVGDVQSIIGGLAPRSKAKLKVIRDGKSKVLDVTTEIMPRSPEEAKLSIKGPKEKASASTEWLGAKFSNPTPSLRDQYNISERLETGVLVTDVPAKSIAADVGFEEGDVIRSINRVRIENVTALKSIGSKIDLKEGMVADVLRDGQWFYLTYKSLQ